MMLQNFVDVIRNPKNTPKVAIFELGKLCTVTKTFSDLIAAQQTWLGLEAYTPVSYRKERNKGASASPQPAITYTKLSIETIEQGVKYVQS